MTRHGRYRRTDRFWTGMVYWYQRRGWIWLGMLELVLVWVIVAAVIKLWPN